MEATLRLGSTPIYALKTRLLTKLSRVALCGVAEPQLAPTTALTDPLSPADWIGTKKEIRIPGLGIDTLPAHFEHFPFVRVCPHCLGKEAPRKEQAAQAEHDPH